MLQRPRDGRFFLVCFEDMCDCFLNPFSIPFALSLSLTPVVQVDKASLGLIGINLPRPSKAKTEPKLPWENPRKMFSLKV
jgi:hypothetical protein